MAPQRSGSKREPRVHQRPPDPAEASRTPITPRRPPDPQEDPKHRFNHQAQVTDPTSDSDPYADAEDPDS